MPVSVYPAPLMLVCETEMLELPLFVTVPEIVWLLPTVTFPKLMLERFAPRVPGFCTPVPPALRPWQPDMMARLARRRSAPSAFSTCFERSFLAVSIIASSQENRGQHLYSCWTGGRLISTSVALVVLKQ